MTMDNTTEIESYVDLQPTNFHGQSIIENASTILIPTKKRKKRLRNAPIKEKSEQEACACQACIIQ